MTKFQGHYGLEFVLNCSPEAIDEAIEKLKRHPNRPDPQERKAVITDPDRQHLAVLQREKAKIRQRGVDRMRQRYMK